MLGYDCVFIVQRSGVRSGKENENCPCRQHIVIVKCPILSVFDCIVGLGENIEFDTLGCIPSGTPSVCVCVTRAQ